MRIIKEWKVTEDDEGDDPLMQIINGGNDGNG
jgi:hypothetical protein